MVIELRLRQIIVRDEEGRRGKQEDQKMKDLISNAIINELRSLSLYLIH